MSCQPSCATCQQLRAAALEVVGNGGIGALCSESLAAQASLPPEEVAAHYPVLASCLHEGYEEEASDLVRTVVEGYEDGADWQSGFERSRADLVEWVSTHPAGIVGVGAAPIFGPVIRLDLSLLESRRRHHQSARVAAQQRERSRRARPIHPFRRDLEYRLRDRLPAQDTWLAAHRAPRAAV